MYSVTILKKEINSFPTFKDAFCYFFNEIQRLNKQDPRGNFYQTLESNSWIEDKKYFGSTFGPNLSIEFAYAIGLIKGNNLQDGYSDGIDENIVSHIFRILAFLFCRERVLLIISQGLIKELLDILKY